MARIRTIKPDFFFNEGLATLSDRTRLFFIGLWCQADRMGRMEDRPGRLRASIFPYDSSINAEELIGELVQMGHLRRYEVDGVKVIQVCKFLKHQRPHNTEAESVLPPCPNGEDTVIPPLDNGEATLGREGKGKERKGKDMVERPTLEQVKAYCQERGGKVDPERWMAYYQSNGWRVGRNPMKDWRAAVRTWERNGFNQPARIAGAAAPVRGKYDGV